MLESDLPSIPGQVSLKKITSSAVTELEFTDYLLEITNNGPIYKI